MVYKTAFILGAGFTHAFNEKAPLLRWDLKEKFDFLIKKYKEFPALKKIIYSIPNHKRINIEAILTRLYSSMPYDGAFLKDGDRVVIYQDIYNYFLELIKNIKLDVDKKTTLDQFAKYVIENEMSCITFNYDTVLDQSLWEYKKTNNELIEKYWHPDGGYGFFCRPAKLLTSEGGFDAVVKDSTKTILLKLHGSLNWKIKKGFQKPYPLDALIHDEEWRGPLTITKEDMSIHLEEFPFVVPPILDKSVLSEQPILRVIWERAFKILSNAERVIFIGYSLPKTDIAASFLLKEALKYKERNAIIIISSGTNKDSKIKTYKDIFPGIKDSQFYFSGAVKWIKTNCVK